MRRLKQIPRGNDRKKSRRVARAVVSGCGEAGVEEELAVAFHAEDGRVDESEGFSADGADGVFHAMDG